MANLRKWQEEVEAIAWINIVLIWLSVPLFAFYIVETLNGDNEESFLSSERNLLLKKIIVKYFIVISFWSPVSIFMTVGATKPNYWLIKACSVCYLIFMFLMAVDLTLERPQSFFVLCAYGVWFSYLLTSLWFMTNFLEDHDLYKSSKTSMQLSSSLQDSEYCVAQNRINERVEELTEMAPPERRQAIIARLENLMNLRAYIMNHEANGSNADAGARREREAISQC